MTKNRKFILTTVCALMFMLCTALSVIFLTVRATDVPLTNDGTWFGAPDLGGEIPNVWTFGDDGAITSTNKDFTGNMLMMTNADLVGDYAIEAVFQGSNNTEIREEINMGFTPWYLDANNFVVVYMKWQSDHGFNLANIQTAYKQNGGDMQWGDCWLDHAYKNTLYTLKPTDSIKLRVEKRLNVTDGMDEYFVTVSSGAISETPSHRGIAMSVPHFNEQAKVGLYTCNDTVKISNFKTESVNINDETTWFGAPDLGGEIPNVWTFGDDGAITSTNKDFTGNMLMTTNEDLVGDYAIEAVFQGSNNTGVTGEINMGFTPWYLDADNFVVVYMKWQSNHGFNLANIQTAYKQNGGDMQWGDCWLDHAYINTLYTLKPTDSIKLRVEKRLNVTDGMDEYFVTVSSGAISETPSHRGIAMSVPHFNEQAKVGLYTCNDTVKISNFKTESISNGATLPQGKALGAAVRLDKNGMRFGFALKEADYNSLGEKFGSNYDIGFAVMKNGITKYRSVKNETWSDITVDGENCKFVVFTILNVPDNEAETVLSYYGYLQIGGIKVSVTETLERSLDWTVKKAYKSAKETNDQAVLNAIISVYGNKYAETE